MKRTFVLHHHAGGLKIRLNLPIAIVPIALTPYIENRNYRRWSHHQWWV